MKTCFRCKLAKPLTEFYCHAKMKDGHLGKCKSCTRNDVKANYENRREQYSEYDRDRFQTPQRKFYVREQQRKGRALNPEKYQARTAVGNALRDGHLIRQPCRVCGERAQAHHDDYSQPLEVDWLCFQHHRELKHGQIVTQV